MTASVTFSEHPAGRLAIGRISLNVEATLNSLTREMVDAISRQLESWAVDDHIVAVFIDGEGDRAFCAGGDVRALRESSIATPGGPCVYAENFFAREYRMNYLLHAFEKPLICWGHGVVMGGGLGILAGCQFRIVSENTRIGMPEITIALFPDVGGSWFLNKMDGQIGRFLALTSSHINGTDALYCGLGTHFLAHKQKALVLSKLSELPWKSEVGTNRDMVHEFLNGLTSDAPQPQGHLEHNMETINDWMLGDDLEVISKLVSEWDGEDAWLKKARDGFKHGSPLAAHWIFRQLNQSRDATLREVFESELILACNIMRHPEFAEGVRALLIDKDRSPIWAYPDLQSVPNELINNFFSAPAGMPSLNLPE